MKNENNPNDNNLLRFACKKNKLSINFDAKYIHKKSIEKLEKKLKETQNGVLIIYDIIDSTERKSQYPNDWCMQTETLYKSFVDLIFRNLGDRYKTNNATPVVIKPIGDAGMAFIPFLDSWNTKDGYVLDKDLVIRYMKELIIFRNEIHLPAVLFGLRIKLVVCLVKNITYIETSIKSKNRAQKIYDILGKEVDFAFRLERYGGHTHIVINKEINDLIKDELNNFDIFSVSKKLKGWDDVQTFHILTNFDDIEAIEVKPFDPLSNDITQELYDYLIKKFRKRILDQQKLCAECKTELLNSTRKS